MRDPATGKYRRTRLFVFTLGYSRKAVRLLVWKSSAQMWAELHERAFRRLGGTVKVIVLDNLREGVLTPDVYDPAINPLYRDVLAHYGVVALPCRVGDPDRKGKVEAGVGHAQKTPLKGLRFETIEAAQAYLDRWETHWADTRIHGTTKRQVAAMFAEERPALARFRSNRFAITGTANARCTSMAVSRSRPRTTAHRLAGSANASTCSGMICTSGCSHRRPGNYYANTCGRRAGGIACTTTTGQRGHRRARSRCSRVRSTAGVHISAVCDHIHQHEGASGIRRMLGVLALAKKHGPAVVDDAAKAALELGVPTYRFLRRYLERRLSVPLTLRQVDPLIRQLTLYRDLIDRKTGDPL